VNLSKQLLSLLEKIDIELDKNPADITNKNYLNEFKKLNEQEFEKFITSKSNKFKKHIQTSYYKRKLVFMDLIKTLRMTKKLKPAKKGTELILLRLLKIWTKTKRNWIIYRTGLETLKPD